MSRLGRYEAYPADHEKDEQDMRDISRERRKRNRERLLSYGKRTIGAFALGLTMVTMNLQKDIVKGKEAVADSHSIMHTIYETDNPDFEDVGTVVATGLGTRDPSDTAEILDSHDNLGNIYALEYSDKDVNIDELTDTVVEKVKEDNIDTLNFDGYSAGGPILLAVAAEIQKDYPDIDVVGIILNSSPIGIDGITERSQEAGDRLSFFVNMHHDLVYSQELRFLVEMIAREHTYLNEDALKNPATIFNVSNISFDWDEFLDQARSVYKDKIANKEAASGALIAAQYEFLLRYGTENNIDILANSEDYGKEPPIIFYTRADDPNNDSVVNVVKSSENLLDLTDNKIPVYIFQDHVGHANPGERPTEYNRMISDHIQPILLEKIQEMRHKQELDEMNKLGVSTNDDLNTLSSDQEQDQDEALFQDKDPFGLARPN